MTYSYLTKKNCQMKHSPKGTVSNFGHFFMFNVNLGLITPPPLPPLNFSREIILEKLFKRKSLCGDGTEYIL